METPELNNENNNESNSFMSTHNTMVTRIDLTSLKNATDKVRDEISKIIVGQHQLTFAALPEHRECVVIAVEGALYARLLALSGITPWLLSILFNLASFLAGLWLWQTLL